MSGGEDGFFGELRGLVDRPQRDPGFTAPPTLPPASEPVHDTARNQISTGTEAGRQRTALRLGAPGPARRDEPNDYRWNLQHRAEHRGFCETTAVIVNDDVGAVIQLIPESATRYVLVITADTTLGISAVEDPVSENSADIDAPMRNRATSFVLTVERHGGAVLELPGVLWSKEVLDADWVPVGVDPALLIAPHDEPTDPTIDRYVFDWTPGINGGDGAWIGERPGRNYQTA